MQMQLITDLFGIPAGDAKVPVRTMNPDVPFTAYPVADPDYVFNKELLKKLLLFFTTPPSRKNLLLIGDTGAGKSSVVEQLAARLNIPVHGLACSGKTRLAHFVGSLTLVSGNTVWRDGPLLMAMRHGGIFCADEITRLDQGEQMSLARVLDGGSITVPETGEVVRASESFRFVGTGNSTGHGDLTGAYNGEKVASVAFTNRFLKMKVDYLPAEDEQNLLLRKAPSLGKMLIERMVSFANSARSQFVSRGGDLRTAVSTRDMVVWALETARYKAFSVSGNPLLEALDDTILNGATPEDSKVLHELWNEWAN